MLEAFNRVMSSAWLQHIEKFVVHRSAFWDEITYVY